MEWIWAESPEVARHVAWVCHIPNVAVNPDELLGKVDAVLVTENAGDTHLLLATPFLRRNLPVFIDKPLASRWEDVRAIWQLTGNAYPIMSCSNLRFNPALEDLASKLTALGEPVLFQGLSAMDWSGYGWHLAEVLVQLWARDAVSVQVLGRLDPIRTIEWHDGGGNTHAVKGGDWTVEVGYPDRRRALLQVFHPMAKTVQVSVHGTLGHHELAIVDPFSMMRRMLVEMVSMIQSGRPPAGIMDDTLEVSRIITGAHLSRARGGTPVFLKEELCL